MANQHESDRNGKHYSKVYGRFDPNSERQDTGQETNPNISSALTSLIDPSIENVSITSFNGFGEGNGSARGAQGTPYLIDRYMSYTKMKKLQVFYFYYG